MWLVKSMSLGVAGMGLVFCVGCVRLTGGPRPLEPQERQLLETGYGVHEVQKPVLPGTPDLSYFDDRDMAADALGRIGAESVPQLQLALKSPEVAVRQFACRALARAGAAAAPAVADLTALLDDSDADVRRLAARALGQIGPAAKDAIPALMRVIGDGHSAPAASPQSTVPPSTVPNADVKPELPPSDSARGA